MKSAVSAVAKKMKAPQVKSDGGGYFLSPSQLVEVVTSKVISRVLFRSTYRGPSYPQASPFLMTIYKPSAPAVNDRKKPPLLAQKMKSKLRNSVEVEVPFRVGCSTWVQKCRNGGSA